MTMNYWNETCQNRSFSEFEFHTHDGTEKEIELDGLKFKAFCETQQDPNQKYYTHKITIICNENSLNNLWKCSAHFEVFVGDVEVKPEYADFVFDCYRKKFVIDGVLCYQLTPITLKIKLENVVGYPSIPYYNLESPGFSDVTFVVEDRDIYAHRAILATNSTYFSAMFLSAFAEKTTPKIRLKDVNSVEFIDFLSAIYPTNFEVTEYNVGCLLRIADMYHAGRVLEKCERFLETTDEMTLGEKLDYAERYRLENLERICIESFQSASEVMDFLNGFSEEGGGVKLDCLSETMQIKVLERFSKFHIPDYLPVEELWKCEINNAKDEKTVEQKFEEWKDTVLLIEGVQLLVNRSYLSIFSSYFQRMFYEDTTRDSFELEDVNCDDFLEFLGYVQEPDKIITDTNIDNISSLSERFEVPYLLNRCKKYWEDVIQEYDTKPFDTNVFLILEASEKFGFSEIQEQVLSRIKTRHELEDLMISHDFQKLGQKSRLAMLRRYFTLKSQKKSPELHDKLRSFEYLLPREAGSCRGRKQPHKVHRNFFLD